MEPEDIDLHSAVKPYTKFRVINFQQLTNIKKLIMNKFEQPFITPEQTLPEIKTTAPEKEEVFKLRSSRQSS